MIKISKFLWPVLALSISSALSPVSAEGISISAERQEFLEGVWSGVPAEASADKLCSKINPPPGTTALSIEFLRTGGVAFADDGSEMAVRGKITSATESNGVITLQFADQVWRLRPESNNVVTRVRSSASLGGDVDLSVFKRCQKPADRTAIKLEAVDLKLLASDLPGDEAYFIDERLVPKGASACALNETQYLFFALVGPADFRLSRWNSFALADKMAAKKPVKLPLDPVSDWRIEEAFRDAGRLAFRLKDYDNEKAPPQTIHLDVKDGRMSVPEWKRTFVRCTGFQSRS